MSHSPVFLWKRAFARMLGAMLLLAITAAGAPAQQSADSEESVQRGKQNFVTYACSACHGYSGQGTDRGSRLDASRLPFAAFERIVRQGLNLMPRYGSQAQLPDSALGDIYDFLKSIPPPPDPASIPLLNEGGSR